MNDPILHAIATYVPEGGENNGDKADRFNLAPDFIENKLGIGRVSRKAADEDTADLCEQAFLKLEASTGLDRADVDCIVVVTQNPDGEGLPHSSAVLHGRLGLPEACASFDISLGCSGYVYGLSIVSSFMHANGCACGLLFTADPYSKIIDPDDRDTVLLFGDGASVSLLKAGADRSGWRPTRFKYMTRGADRAALCVVNGHLSMKGRQVFNFSATAVPPLVNALLKEAGLGTEDIDQFLFHQGSKYIVDALRQRLKLPAEKVPLKLYEQGNTVSTSIPLMLEMAIANPDARRLLLSGFGVGLSAAVCLLERQS